MTSQPSDQARARFVQVAVNSGRPTFMTFSYRVPHGREVEPGEVVHVPFGRQELQGVVVEAPTDLPGYSGDIRELLPPVEGAPRLDETQLQLASWIAGYYLAPPWEAHALMLPPGAGERPRTFVVRGEAERPATLSERQGLLYDCSTRRRARSATCAPPPARAASTRPSARSSGAAWPSAATSLPGLAGVPASSRSSASQRIRTGPAPSQPPSRGGAPRGGHARCARSSTPAVRRSRSTSWDGSRAARRPWRR